MTVAFYRTGLTLSPQAYYRAVPALIYFLTELCGQTQFFHSLQQNIDTGIFVPLALRLTFRTLPLPNTKVFDLWVLIPASRTGLTGREEAVHAVDGSAVPFRLVEEHLLETSPTGITDSFGQPSVFHQPFGIQEHITWFS